MGEVKIGYGIMLPKISEQVTAHGYSFDKKRMKEFDDIREHLNKLRFASMFTDSQFSKLLQKLHNKVISHLNAKNK